MFENDYAHPRGGPAGRAIGRIANSARLAAMRRSIFSRLPFPVLVSDVRDIVYATWLLDAGRVRAVMPAGVRLWERDGLTPFTILTYAHGHFGPRAFGPLRRVFGSPLQSNWRLYLHDAPGASVPHMILFVRNVLNSLPYVLAARVFSDALPAHFAAEFVHRRDGERLFTRISPGRGSAPALEISAAVSGEKNLPDAFSGLFPSWLEAVEFLACQNAAVVPVRGTDRLALAEIALPFRLSETVPMAPQPGFLCPLLEPFAPQGDPLCFMIPGVEFRAVSERLL